MTKKDFLLSLSKDELVELLFDFSETNREAGDFIQKKIYQAEAARQNNKKENLSENPKTRNEESPAAKIPANTNAINRFSSPEEKIALFKSLFSGRTDVFALRWHNEKSNKSGYSPVCKNKWLSGKCDLKKYSCAACPFKFLESLSDSRIYNHLAGKDLYCRDVIGIYPLLLDNCCNFLAFDFDSHKKTLRIQKNLTMQLMTTAILRNGKTMFAQSAKPAVNIQFFIPLKFRVLETAHICGFSSAKK